MWHSEKLKGLSPALDLFGFSLLDESMVCVWYECPRDQTGCLHMSMFKYTLCFFLIIPKSKTVNAAIYHSGLHHYPTLAMPKLESNPSHSTLHYISKKHAGVSMGGHLVGVLYYIPKG